MPSTPLKLSKAKAKRRAWHGQRPGKHPSRFSGIKSARRPGDTCHTSYEFSSDHSTPKANLLTGLGVDETFSRTDASGARHLLTDALGSTLALTDGTGAVQTSYSYEPYGKTTVSGTASSNSFEYTGRENDNTGLYFYRARYYNPGLQRFVSEDPIGLAGGVNVYAYVGGNPLSKTDPLGLAATSPVPAPAPSMSFAPWAPESQQDICVASNDYSKRKSYCLAFCQYELAMPGRFDNFGPHRACMRRCMGSGGFTM